MLHAALTTLLAATLAAPPVTPTPVKPKPAPASALAIVPIVLTGGAADDTLHAQLLAHLQSGLARGAFTLVDEATVAAESPGECRERGCLTGLAKKTGANFVLRPAVRVDDRDYVVRLELYGQSGDLLAESEERCDLCGVAEVGALVEAQAALLRRKLEGLIRGQPRLTVTTDPPGALVLVDDQLVGTAPVDRTLLEGEHIVRVLLDGYVGDERRVKLVAGVHESLELPLRREPRLARFRQLGVAGVATGAPVALLGLTLLGYDGEDFKGNCTGANRDAQGDCRFVFDTAWAGGAALALGVGLIAAGTVLLLRNRDRPAKRQARVLPTGLGLAGRF